MYGFEPTSPELTYSEHQKLFKPKAWEALYVELAKTVETGFSTNLY